MTIHAGISFDKNEILIKSLSVSVGYTSIKISKEEKLHSILCQYYLYYKLKEVNSEREDNKKYFQKMLNVVGVEVKRDALIDQILTYEKGIDKK